MNIRVKQIVPTSKLINYYRLLFIFYIPLSYHYNRLPRAYFYKARRSKTIRVLLRQRDNVKKSFDFK